ncbi:MAG: hypothetical protein LUC83_11085 [Clostridiales bacterium]|nr:hypothetical protein [Clostridiales bacterium]
MQDCKIIILGEEWTIKFGKEAQYPNLDVNSGYCDSSAREIIIDDMESIRGDKTAKTNLTDLKHKVLRHEIIHAYLEESGLSENSCATECGWAENEEMVDGFAIKTPKIFRTFLELGIL